MGSSNTHYDTLQVARTASDAVIRAAYKSLSQKYHPDKNPDSRAEAERVMKSINEAYQFLSDPSKRREYDAWIIAVEQPGVVNRVESQAPPKSPHPPAIKPRSIHGFFVRAWLMFLFVASLVMLLGWLPYTVIAGEFKWPHLAGLFIWLAVGHYAYTKLFPSRDA